MDFRNRKQIAKIGEGSFGEVFTITDSENNLVVAKFIPVEGELDYNGGPQTTFDGIISEKFSAFVITNIGHLYEFIFITSHMIIYFGGIIGLDRACSGVSKIVFHSSTKI